MTRLLLAFLSWFRAFFRSRHDLALEFIALRQQVGVLRRKNPRPRLNRGDRLSWLALRRRCSRWASVLVVPGELLICLEFREFSVYCYDAEMRGSAA
jgi:hypothetical protein